MGVSTTMERPVEVIQSPPTIEGLRSQREALVAALSTLGQNPTTAAGQAQRFELRCRIEGLNSQIVVLQRQVADDEAECQQQKRSAERIRNLLATLGETRHRLAKAKRFEKKLRAGLLEAEQKREALEKFISDGRQQVDRLIVDVTR